MNIRLSLLLLLSASALANALRLGQQDEARHLDEEEENKKRLNWGDGFDNIDGGGLGDFLDDIKDGVGDFIDNITDGWDDGWGNDNGGDGFGDFVDHGEGWPDNWPNLTDGIVDWIDFDFADFDFENFTWDLIDWDENTWDDFLIDMDFNNTDVNFCSILESAIGIGKGFGIEGDCSCNGDLDRDLAIGCDFQHQCYDQSFLCTEVKVNYTMGNDVSVGACVNFEGDTFPEVCFSYSYDLTGQGEQTCTAQYDGNACECEIEDLCLSLNCSMYLPGAAFDSCQLLETIFGEDIATFLPQFPVFDENFTQFFDDIPWESLDWENLDKQNFKMDQIEWGSSAQSRYFGDIVNVDPNDDLVCPILQMFIGMSDEFSSKGGCTCNADIEEGFSMDCSFEDACISEEICASVGLQFAFDELGAVSSEACVNFANDGHPETCFAFDIPVADGNRAPTCSATYGGLDCKCTIDDDFCVAVDCSEHEPTAVADSCQGFSMQGSDAASFIPRFAERRTGNDGDNEDNSGSSTGNDNGTTGDSQGLTDGSSAASSMVIASLFIPLPALLSLL